jgi:hypothetical protein
MSSSENTITGPPSQRHFVSFDQLVKGKQYSLKTDKDLDVLHHCPANNAADFQQKSDELEKLKGFYLLLDRSGLDPNGNRRAVFDSGRVRFYPECVLDRATGSSPEFQFIEYPGAATAPKAIGGKRRKTRRILRNLLHKKKSRKCYTFSYLRRKSKKMKRY